MVINAISEPRLTLKLIPRFAAMFPVMFQIKHSTRLSLIQILRIKSRG